MLQGRIVRLMLAATFVWVTLVAGTSPAHAEIADKSRGVVKLFVTRQSWDLRQPWTKRPVSKVTCSGFLVEQGILTNAHCVAESTYIEIEVQGLPDKVQGKLKAINDQLDLALVELADPAALDSLANPLPRIQFGPLPEYRAKVVTVGYPTGGRQISYTEGVVSRIDVMRYAHSQLPSLLVQTDAAINPGNSGGPVFSDETGRCLGVATQKMAGGEGLGYFVPTSMIRHFFDDLEDGSVDGIPNLGIVYQTLESDAYRRKLKLNPGQSGVRVSQIAAGSTADGYLKVDDVILRVAGHQVYNDGRVPFREDHRIGFGYYVYNRQVADELDLRISRDGEVLDLEVPLQPYRFAVVPHMPEYGKEPEYFVKAGLVFLRVEPRYLWRWGGPWSRRLPASLKNYVMAPLGEEGLEELVVISEIYDSAVNKGYGSQVENVRVTSVNGVAVHNLQDVVEGIDQAQKDQVPYIEILLEDDNRIVLDREAALAADESIKARYGIQ